MGMISLSRLRSHREYDGGRLVEPLGHEGIDSAYKAHDAFLKRLDSQPMGLVKG